MKQITIIVFGLFLIMSCSSTEPEDQETKETTQSKTADTPLDSSKTESEEQATDLGSEQHVLPTGQLQKLEDMDFEIQDTIVVQEFEAGNLAGLATVEIFMTEELDIVMGVSNEDGLFIDWFLIEIGDVGPWTSDIKVSLEDICGDDEEELVLWWETLDGHSGFYEGYEMDRSGVMVLNAYSMKAYLDFAYNDHYMSYQAPYEDETNEEEAVHGKMNENSQVDVCSYFMDVAVSKGQVSISNYEKTVETSEDCVIEEVEEGIYKFDQSKEAFFGPVKQ